MKRVERKYGWLRDLPSQVPWFDHEGLLRAARTPDVTAWRRFLRWCYDQGSEGSCTANSGQGATRLRRAILGMHDFDGARQFLYAMTLRLTQPNPTDTGATISDTVRAEWLYGVPLESSWPYRTPLSQDPRKNAKVMAEAQRHQLLGKAPVQQTQEAIEACLAAGQPVQFGMMLHQSFESFAVQRTGIVPMPRMFERQLGGHAMYLFDYNRPKRKFYGPTSWGPTFGQDRLGILEFPYELILDTDTAADFWTYITPEE